jgi:hypothetical protein
VIRQEEEIKGIQIGIDLVKVSLFVDDIILHVKDPKNSTQNFLYIINSFSNVAGYKINSQNSVDFLYTSNEQVEKGYGKTIPLTIASKKSNT